MDSFMFKNTEKRQILIKNKVLLYSTWHYIQYSQYRNGEEYEKESIDVYMYNTLVYNRN